MACQLCRSAARSSSATLGHAKRAAPKPHRWLHRISSVERALSRAPPLGCRLWLRTHGSRRVPVLPAISADEYARTHFAPLDGAAGAPVAAAAPAQRRRQQPHYSPMSSPLGERRADEHARTLSRSGTAARQPPLQTNTCQRHTGPNARREGESVTIPQGFHRESVTIPQGFHTVIGCGVVSYVNRCSFLRTAFACIFAHYSTFVRILAHFFRAAF